MVIRGYTFGKGEPASKYLELIQKVLPLEYLMRKKKQLTEEESATVIEALEKTKDFRKTLYEYSPVSAFHRRNCHLFTSFVDIAEFVLNTAVQMKDGISKEQAEKLNEECQRLIFRKEAEMPCYFHGMTWFHWIRALINAHIVE